MGKVRLFSNGRSRYIETNTDGVLGFGFACFQLIETGLTVQFWLASNLDSSVFPYSAGHIGLLVLKGSSIFPFLYILQYFYVTYT